MGATPTITYSDVQGGSAGTGNINLDPKFVSSPEGNYRLLSSSPCIDTASIEAPTNDLNNYPRPIGSGNDMGAYEFQAPTVIVVQPNGGEVWDPYKKYKVMWLLSSEADDIYVRLSTNNGSSWTTLVTHEAWIHNGLCTYEWTVGEYNSTQCLISVEAGDKGDWKYDISNATFEITSARPIVYVATDGSDETGDGSLDNPYRTVQKGVNTVAVSGEVRMKPGLYTLATTSEYVNYSMVNWPNKTGITLKLSPEATGTATLDAQDYGRIIYVGNAVSLSIESITIQNGLFYNIAYSAGAGIFLPANSVLNLKNVVMRNNRVSGASTCGGGIYAAGAKVYANNCWFISNGSQAYAGVCYSDTGTFEATNCVFYDNGAWAALLTEANAN